MLDLKSSQTQQFPSDGIYLIHLALYGLERATLDLSSSMVLLF